jgi:hypothetical protein
MFDPKARHDHIEILAEKKRQRLIEAHAQDRMRGGRLHHI